MSAASFVTSSTATAGPSCTNLFIDVGANNGNSLRFWFSPTDSGHGMAEYARIERALVVVVSVRLDGGPGNHTRPVRTLCSGRIECSLLLGVVQHADLAF